MRKISAGIIFFIFLIISSFLFTKDAYAILCHPHFPVIKCLPSTSPFDCEPITGEKFCCKDQLECSTHKGVAVGAVGAGGSCAGLDGEKIIPMDPKTPYGKCIECTNGITLKGPTGVWTALGCVNTKPEDFVAQLLGWVIGLGGGIAFLLIVWGGFQIVTSSGDPEKLNAGKEIIVSALTGLLMIVFSVILLKIIGVDILKIPGFNK